MKIASYMKYKISICIAVPGYTIDQTIYPFTVVKLASKLGLQRFHDTRVCTVDSCNCFLHKPVNLYFGIDVQIIDYA